MFSRPVEWIVPCVHSPVESVRTVCAAHVPGIAARRRCCQPLAWLHESSDEWSIPSQWQIWRIPARCRLRFVHARIKAKRTRPRPHARAPVCVCARKIFNPKSQSNVVSVCFPCIQSYSTCERVLSTTAYTLQCLYDLVRCDLCGRARNRIMRSCLYYTPNVVTVRYAIVSNCWMSCCRRCRIHAANFVFGSVVSWLSIDYVRVTVVRCVNSEKKKKKFCKNKGTTKTECGKKSSYHSHRMRWKIVQKKVYRRNSSISQHSFRMINFSFLLFSRKARYQIQITLRWVFHSFV